MLSARPVASPRSLLAGFGIVGIGVLVALVTDVALTLLSPATLAFVLGGFALLIPTIVLKNPKAPAGAIGPLRYLQMAVGWAD